MVSVETGKATGLLLLPLFEFEFDMMLTRDEFFFFGNFIGRDLFFSFFFLKFQSNIY